MTEGDTTSLAPGQRRLQREPDFTGQRLSSFREVALRHGLPGALLGLACLALPQTRELLQAGLTQAADNPVRLLMVALVIFACLNLYAWYLDRSWNARKAGWVIYLGAVSAWEEWVFRLALPYYAESMGVSLLAAVIASNLVFALAHYFTLRWKWQWCLAAFIGGMALSRQFAEQENLILVIFIHWIATFINTPRLPGSRISADRSPPGREGESNDSSR